MVQNEKNAWFYYTIYNIKNKNIIMALFSIYKISSIDGNQLENTTTYLLYVNSTINPQDFKKTWIPNSHTRSQGTIWIMLDLTVKNSLFANDEKICSYT